MAKKVLITDTILRDAHQSQAATRMTTAQMLPRYTATEGSPYPLRRYCPRPTPRTFLRVLRNIRWCERDSSCTK
mgnify:CR=1 FL=1